MTTNGRTNRRRAAIGVENLEGRKLMTTFLKFDNPVLVGLHGPTQIDVLKLSYGGTLAGGLNVSTLTVEIPETPAIVRALVHAEESGKGIGRIELVTTHGKLVETDEVLAGVTVVGVQESGSSVGDKPELSITFHFSSITAQHGQPAPASGTIQGITKVSTGI